MFTELLVARQRLCVIRYMSRDCLRVVPVFDELTVCDCLRLMLVCRGTECRLSASRACFRWTHCLRLSETHARLSRNRVDCLRVVPVCQGTHNPFSHNLYSFPGLSSLIKNRCDIFIANLLLLLVGVCTKQTLRVLINEINYQWYTWSITIF